jgi:hypothetical protein
MRKSRKRSKRRVSRRRVSRRRVSKRRVSKRRVSKRRVSKRRVSRRRVSQGFRYSMDEEPLIDMCPVCLEKRELIPLGCGGGGGGRHGVCNKCIVRTMRADTRCPLCRNPGGGDPWGHGGGGGAPGETASFADLDRRFQEIMRRQEDDASAHEEEVANWAAVEEAAISARLSMMHRRQERLRRPHREARALEVATEITRIHDAAAISERRSREQMRRRLDTANAAAATAARERSQMELMGLMRRSSAPRARGQRSPPRLIDE